jgi:hypothetical protein
MGGVQSFFFDFCKVASVATSNVQLVILWQKARWCKSSLWPPLAYYLYKPGCHFNFYGELFDPFTQLLGEKKLAKNEHRVFWLLNNCIWSLYGEV